MSTDVPLSSSPVPAPSPGAATRHVEVVAGVIRDARGRVLLARRTEGRDLAGLWEFPGGKHEPGESAEDALARELHEELGIEVEIGAPLISVPQQYPDKRLCLDVRLIAQWRGQVRGREGQALVWVPPPKLIAYAMPPADRPVVAALLQPAHYLVTPTPVDDAQWLTSLQRAFDTGVRRVQLRAPGLDPQRWRDLVARAVLAARVAGVDLLVNADATLAQVHGIGLHLTAAQLMAQRERPLPEGLTLAASCHTLEELQAAEALGCEFAVLGNVRATPSHPGRGGIGWEGFARLRESVSLPLYAIGGLTAQDIDTVRGVGGQGIAAIRGLWPTA
ncbi:Nudix family hydrolase [Lysobacter sp. LF1]|uniref:8-oxo-dGTP diphosphatase n=1 Tax=Lysobacter stagni TaxID=3045172 RepID=A0ABT6XFA4_9GAMM|nr:Nudix family hydrolase [Lysobacter sp. LF1]MDI9238823.1 Nudix family hydrolase [Lysobacter sp. LF1]